jgi:hypothetical protein
MHIKNRYFLLLVFTLLGFAITGTQVSRQIPKEISDCLNKGNARELARHFNNNIELVILDNEDVYSKSQAELILRDFFSVNTPVKFVLLHQGGPLSSRFGIGNLETKNGDFRIYFLLKLKDGTQLIHLLRIERMEEAYSHPDPEFTGGV